MPQRQAITMIIVYCSKPQQTDAVTPTPLAHRSHTCMRALALGHDRVSFFISMWLWGTCTISIPRSTVASRVWSQRPLGGIRDTAQSAVTRTGTEPSRRFWHVCVAALGFRIAHACGSRDAMRCSRAVCTESPWPKGPNPPEPPGNTHSLLV